MEAASKPTSPGRAARVQDMLNVVGWVFMGIGAAGIEVLMVLTVIGVFWRYVLVDPIFGLQDVSSMTAALVAASAVAYGATQNSHITVNIMPKQFGRGVRRVTDVAARLIGTVILALAAQALVKKGACGLPCGNVTGNLSIPHGPFYCALAAGLGFFALYTAVQTLVGLAHWSDDDPNEVME